MNDKNERTKVQNAFDELEQAFVRYKEDIAQRRNRLPQGSQEQVEIDLSAVDKAHLNLLRGNLEMEAYGQLSHAVKEVSSTGERLDRRIYWLNIAIALLTIAVAASAIIELID